MSFVAISWLFFRVARSSRIDLDMLVARALKNSQLTCGERHAYFGARTLDQGSKYLSAEGRLFCIELWQRNQEQCVGGARR